MKTTNETTVTTQEAAQLAALREMTAQAVAECWDADLLDLVYKLLVTPLEPKPERKPTPKQIPKPELPAEQVDYYRAELPALLDKAPGYILAMTYGFTKTLMEG